MPFRYPILRKDLTRQLRDHWFEWDPDDDGSISMKELVCKNPRGLKEFFLDYIRSKKEKAMLSKTPMEGAQLDMNIPSLDTHPREWFSYWDADNSGR